MPAANSSGEQVRALVNAVARSGVTAGSVSVIPSPYKATAQIDSKMPTDASDRLTGSTLTASADRT
jgi:hypothetical protein